MNPRELSKKELNNSIVEAIQDVKGEGIVLLDLQQIPEASADYFIICHGNSSTHIKGILKSIEKKIANNLQIAPGRTEGTNGKTWMLIDYFSTVVHVFAKEIRSHYNLEGLWSDALITKYDD